MKTNKSSLIIVLAALVLSLLPSGLFAQDGSWAVDADGTWSTAGNWLGSTIADGVGSTASFTNTITATRTVTSDVARTNGNLVFAGSAALNWTLTNSAAYVLNNASGLATITVSSNTVNINANSAVGGISGTNTVLKNGVGGVNLPWSSTYSGGTVIGQGQVNITAVGSGQLGTGSVTVTNGSTLNLLDGNTTDQNRVCAFTNTLTVPSGQTGTVWLSARSVTGVAGSASAVTGPVTGAGTLVLRANNGTRGGCALNFSAFTGTVNITGRTGADNFPVALAGTVAPGFPSAKVHLSAGVYMYQWLNPPSGTGTQTLQPIGELSGDVGSSLSGNPISGRFVNWTVGYLNTSSTFAGVIRDDVGATRFTKVGTGTLTLSGTNTFTGATLISTGAVYFVTGGSCSNTASITVASNATFGVQIASAGGQWVGTNVIFNAGSNFLAFNFGTIVPSTTVSPMLILANWTNNGTVYVGAVGGSSWAPGVYPLASYTGVLGGSGTFALGATLPLRVSATLSNDVPSKTLYLVVSAVNTPAHWAVGNGNWDIATTANWQDAANVSSTYQEQLGLGDQVLFNDAASGIGTITVTLNTNVTPASLLFSNVTKNYVLTGTSNILGTTALIKNGAGTLTLQNTNSYSGGTYLNGGILNFTSLNNLGTGGINFSNGTLQFASGNTTDISTRTVWFGGAGTIDTAGNNVTLANRIGNSGPGGMIKTGAGILTISTNSSYTGNTTVNGGTLALGANASLSNSPAIVVTNGAILDTSAAGGLPLDGLTSQILAGSGTVNGSVTTVGSTKLSPGTNGVVGTLTMNNNLTLNGGTFYFDVGTSSRDLIVVGGTLNLNGSISGTLQVNALALLNINSTNKLFQYPAGQLTGGGMGTFSLAVSGVAQSGRLLSLDNSVDGEIDLVVLAAPAHNLTWAGDGSGNAWDISSPNWTGTTNVYSDGDNANFTDAGAANSPVNLVPSAVTPNSVTFNATNNYTINGVKITGPATLTKTNSGTVILNNVGNDYGMTIIKAGVLQIGDGSTSGTSIGQGAVTNNASLVFNQPDNSSVAGDISGTGSLSKQGSGTLTLLGNNTYVGATTVDTGVLSVGNGGVSGTLTASAVTLANSGTLDMNNLNTYSLANGISGNGTLKFDGGATVTFGGANSYLQNTYINSGTVKLAADNVIPNGGSTTGWLILDGGASTAGTLDLNGHNQAVNELSGTTGTVLGQIVNNGSGLNTLTIGTALASTTYVGLIKNNNNAGSGQIGLKIIGDGTLANSLTLSGANSYTGPVYIDGASVIMGGSIGTIGQQSIGTGQITLTNGGSLQMNGYGSSTQSGNFVNNILVPAGATGNLKTVGRGNYAGSMTVHGTLNLTTSYIRSTPSGDWSASDGYINILAGTGGGDVYLNNAGNINWGTASVDLGASVNVYNSANTGTSGNTFTIGALTGTGTIQDCNGTGGTNRITTLIVGGRNSDFTFSGTIKNSLRQTAVTKVGSGTWTMSGNNTYTASTTISSGTMMLGTTSSFMSSCTNITVAAGALFDVSIYNGLTLSISQTLAGSGVITGLVTAVTGDIISPGVGTAAGTLSFSNSLTETGDFVTNNFNLSSDPTGVSLTNSKVVVQGDLTLTGANILTINPLNNFLGAGTYTLFKYTGSLITNGTAAGVGATLNNSLVPGGAFVANSDASFIVSNAPGAVVLIFKPTGQNLVWQGGITGTATNNWDINVSSNWLSSLVVTNYRNYDNVTFDNSSTNQTVVLAAGTTLFPTAITVNSDSNYVFSGSGKLSGTTSLTKAGTGTLTLTNTTANDFSGATTVSNGAIYLRTTGMLSPNSSLEIKSAGSVKINGWSPTIGGLSGSGAIDNNGATASVLTVGSLGNGIWSGAISNSGAGGISLLLNDTNNLTVSGVNQLNSAAASQINNGSASLIITNNGVISLSTGEFWIGSALATTGKVVVAGGSLVVSNNWLVIGRGFTNANGTMIVNSGSTVQKAGTNNIVVGSLGATGLLAVNAGGTVLNSGNLWVGEGDYANATVNLNGGLLQATQIRTNGGLVTSSVINFNGGTLQASAASANFIQGVTANVLGGGLILDDNGFALSISRPLINGGGGGGLTKQGAGTVNLDAVNTYTGPTLINAGTLGGVGTIAGNLTNNATLAPGDNGVGTLTVSGSLKLNAVSTNAFDVNGSTSAHDTIVAGGAVGYGGVLQIVPAGTFTGGQTFTLFSGAGAASASNFASIAGSPGSGLGFTFTNGVLSVVTTMANYSTNITSKVNGSNLEITWPATHLGWMIQAQTNTLSVGLSGNWVTISNTATQLGYTNTLDATKGTVFFRLSKP